MPSVKEDFRSDRYIYLKNENDADFNIKYLPYLSNYCPWEIQNTYQTRYSTFETAYNAVISSNKVVMTISETDSGYTIIDNQIKAINGKRSELITNEINRLERTIEFLKTLNN